jgi:hypothetical protein
MDYRPNVQAVRAFADDCLPALLAERPDLCFAIVGRDPTPAVLRLGDRPGIIVTGSVPDVRTWLARPMPSSRRCGSRAASRTRCSRRWRWRGRWSLRPPPSRGIDATPGRDLLVADTPGEQVSAILSLIANPKSAIAIGAAARRQMNACYRWDAVLAPLTELMAQSEPQAVR